MLEQIVGGLIGGAVVALSALIVFAVAWGKYGERVTTALSQTSKLFELVRPIDGMKVRQDVHQQWLERHDREISEIRAKPIQGD